MKRINIGLDFSDTPLGRYPTDSEVSGERFRDEFLLPALKEHDQVVVKIDDAEGYGSSFLEEAFGGVVRKGNFDEAALKKRLTIEYQNPEFRIYHTLIWRYIAAASRHQMA